MAHFLQWVGRIIGGLILAVALLVGLHYAFVELQSYGTALILTPQDQLRPPYLHLGDQQPVTMLHPNQFFFVHIDASRNKACIASRYYRILSEVPDRSSQHLVVWLTYPESISNTSPGIYEGDTLLQLPVWLPPGAYLLDRYAMFNCNGVKIDPTSRVEFHVELPVNNDPPRVPAETP